MAGKHDLRHLVSDAPRVMVVDGSKLVRKLIGDVLAKSLPGATVTQAGSVVAARALLAEGGIDLVTTSLALPDGDGVAVAEAVRESAGQAYVPVIVVSGEAQARLEARTLGEEVTDYFDKSLGMEALATFIRGYVVPEPIPGAHVLYVEDSRVVALATKRMLEAHAMTVTHVDTAEAALEFLHEHRSEDDIGTDLLLSDVYLKGALSGHELLNQVRKAFGYSKRRLPVVVMTGDDNREHQASLLREGANDLVLKPIEERLLVIKSLFQLRAAKTPERRAFDA